MGVCLLVDELKRLRKSSSDSIDSEKSFDEFKQYMHIRRNVEDDLKLLLREVRQSGRKTLVLLCGSAGDGKSHMLSYLKNSDEENLLEGFRIYNDATESSAPNKTAIETLSEVLDDFSDSRIESPGGSLILAINLGVLNNFIESEYGKEYSELKKYVEVQDILSTTIIENKFKKESVFQHINFADYQLYSLSKKGVHSDYIEEILAKIYGNEPDNPFWGKFNSGCRECALSKKCPVKYNFLFLQNLNVRKYITDILIMTIIKEKVILTTREVLNYFYDITVPQDFTYSGLSGSLSNTFVTLKLFLSGMTPSLIFDQEGVTTLMDHAKKNDPLFERTEKNDDFAVNYYVSADTSLIITEFFKDSVYGEYLLQKECLEAVNQDKIVQEMMFRCFTRINVMNECRITDPIYENYIKYLYFYNAGDKRKLGALYDAVEKAVLQWCGTDGDNHLCLDSKDSQYSLYENVEFDADLNCIPNETENDELQRFSAELKIGFENQKGRDETGTELEIDYPLYRLIDRLNKGYIHTTNDRNNHADFIGFVEKILKSGNADEEIFVISNKGEHAVLQKTKFGYKFGVTR